MTNNESLLDESGESRVKLRLIYNYISENSPKMALQVVDRVTTRSQQLRDIHDQGDRYRNTIDLTYASYWKDPAASFTK